MSDDLTTADESTEAGEIREAPVLSIERAAQDDQVPPGIPFLPLPVKVNLQIVAGKDGNPAILLIPANPAIPDGVPFMLPIQTAESLANALVQAISQAKSLMGPQIIVPQMARPMTLG